MPTAYCDGDQKWIESMLLQLDPATRVKIAMKYAEVYQETLDSTPVPEHQRENVARGAANVRLREFVKRYAAASVGYTELPPVMG